MQSTSVPALVSDASITDLYSHFKRCCTSKNGTFVGRFRRPKGSPRNSNTREFPRCSPKNPPKTCPSHNSHNNYTHKDSLKICLPKNLPRIYFPEQSPRTCLPIERTGSRSSPINFPLKESPKTSVSKESYSSQKSPRFCVKPKKTRFKCESGTSSHSSDEAMITANNSECVEDLYFNDKAETSGGSTPR